MIKIHSFAGLKRTFPHLMERELNCHVTVADLIRELKTEYKDAANLLSASRVAIDAELVDMSTVVKDQMELFIIPPSSGG